jgi:hypothetical protein
MLTLESLQERNDKVTSIITSIESKNSYQKKKKATLLKQADELRQEIKNDISDEIHIVEYH